MSKRRKPGEIVIKKANAGFVGEVLRVRIEPDEDEATYGKMGVSYCMLDCGDVECREWSNLTALSEDGKELGGVYHVSECQMEDIA